jgi:hypothetical protein
MLWSAHFLQPPMRQNIICDIHFVYKYTVLYNISRSSTGNVCFNIHILPCSYFSLRWSMLISCGVMYQSLLYRIMLKMLKRYKDERWNTCWNASYSVLTTNFMDLGPWEVANCSAAQELPKFYGTPRYIIVFTRALHWPISWARSIQSIPPHPV